MPKPGAWKGASLDKKRAARKKAKCQKQRDERKSANDVMQRLLIVSLEDKAAKKRPAAANDQSREA